MNKEWELKCSCGSTIFNIFNKSDCGVCRYNGYEEHRDDGSVYQHDKIDSNIDRTQVEYEGECEMGHSFNFGCHLYSCAVCGKIKEHVPLMEG